MTPLRLLRCGLSLLILAGGCAFDPAEPDPFPCNDAFLQCPSGHHCNGKICVPDGVDAAPPDRGSDARPDAGDGPRADRAVGKDSRPPDMDRTDGSTPPDRGPIKKDKQPPPPDKSGPTPDKAPPPPDKAPPPPDKAAPPPDKSGPTLDKAAPQQDKAPVPPDKALPKPDMKVTCIPNTDYWCDQASGDIVWRDSCGKAGAVYLKCCAGCSGTSKTCPTPATGGVPGQGGGCCAGATGCTVDELVGWYRMDEPHKNSKPIDSSGKGGSGTRDAVTVVGQAGPMFRAYVFNSSTASLYSKAMDIGAGSLTLQVWILLKTASSTAQGVLQKLTFSPKRGFYLYHQSGKITFCMGDGSGGQCDRSVSAAVPTNTWFHLAAVLDRGAGSVDLYLDGQLKSSGSLGSLGSVATSAALVLGKAIWSPSKFIGLMDDLRMYNHARSASQVAVDAGQAAFRVVPGGAYYMGSPLGEHCRQSTGEPRHRVTLTSALEVGTTEVLRRHFISLMKYTPVAKSACGSACAVDNVNWHEAAAYCNALTDQRKAGAKCYSCSSSGAAVTCAEAAGFKGKSAYACPGYRLPTEAEWEYLYRADVHTAYSNGHNTKGLCQGADTLASHIAWYDQTASGALQPPALKHPNRWGLYDLAGSLAEWCHDPHQPNPGTAPLTNPVGSGSANRPSRGGAWSGSAFMTRAAYRGFLGLAMRGGTTGFRCVRSVKPTCPGTMTLVNSGAVLFCVDPSDSAGKSRTEAAKACKARGAGGRICSSTDLSMAAAAGAVKTTKPLATPSVGSCCCQCGGYPGQDLTFWHPTKPTYCGCWRSDFGKSGVNHRCCADAK